MYRLHCQAIELPVPRDIVTKDSWLAFEPPPRVGDFAGACIMLADGPDEVHHHQVAKLGLARYA